MTEESVVAELASRLARYEHWTPEHTIEEWCDELKKKLATERDDICKIIERSEVWYSPTLITLIKEGYMPPQDCHQAQPATKPYDGNDGRK